MSPTSELDTAPKRSQQLLPEGSWAWGWRRQRACGERRRWHMALAGRVVMGPLLERIGECPRKGLLCALADRGGRQSHSCAGALGPDPDPGGGSPRYVWI